MNMGGLKNKMEKSEKRELKNVEISGIITFISLLALLFIISYTGFLFTSTGNVIEDGEESFDGDFSFYSEDSCRCIEKNKPECSLDGFEYDKERNLCVNSESKTVTNSVLRCSIYECFGTVYSIVKFFRSLLFHVSFPRILLL